MQVPGTIQSGLNLYRLQLYLRIISRTSFSSSFESLPGEQQVRCRSLQFLESSKPLLENRLASLHRKPPVPKVSSR